MFVSLYRKYVPVKIRESIYSFVLKDLLYVYRNFNVLIKAKAVYFFPFLFPKNPINNMYRFMGRNGLTYYPWDFTSEYKAAAACLFDKSKGLYYVLHNDKKLFFPQTYTLTQIQNTYRTLLIEQDFRSPHRYLENDYDTLEGMILLDIGAAEGIFSLDAINYVKQIYLFECEPMWMEALTATFEPWKNKVTIVPKYVTNKNNDLEITIDALFNEQSHKDLNLFFKMDIEGFEMSALQGAENILKQQKQVKLSVCTYHRPTDASDIENYLHTLNFSTSFTDGYLFFNKNFNRVMIRAQKNGAHES